MKKARDFLGRSREDQLWLLKNTWCDRCQQADLGLIEPLEFEKAGQIFLEGKCKRCGATVVTEISNTNQ